MRNILILFVLVLFIAGCQPGGEAIAGQRSAAVPKQPAEEIEFKTCNCEYAYAATCVCELAKGLRVLKQPIANVPPSGKVAIPPNEVLECIGSAIYYGVNSCFTARYIDLGGLVYAPTTKRCNVDTDCLPVRATCPQLSITLSTALRAQVSAKAASLITCSNAASTPKCTAYGQLRRAVCK